jgi:hypothetical protein
MAKGKPSKWARVEISEPFYIGKRGITIKVWDKHGRRHLGNATITIGGIHWYPYKKKKATKLLRWDQLNDT